MKNIIFILMVLFATSVCFSQSNFWKKSKLNSPEYSSYVKNLQKDKYQIFSLDYDKLKAKLVNAPSRTNQSLRFMKPFCWLQLLQSNIRILKHI